MQTLDTKFRTNFLKYDYPKKYFHSNLKRSLFTIFENRVLRMTLSCHREITHIEEIPPFSINRPNRFHDDVSEPVAGFLQVQMTGWILPVTGDNCRQAAEAY